MAQPNTQDTQKVFNSATENFKSFVGSVENVSHTKHMEEIYANMTKLFDAFTNGALLGQGANSETLLRTVYRSLNEDFLQVVQDTEAVDKLIEVIKSKQEGIVPEKVEEAMVSETTKKVVTKTLDPETCDPMQVVLDFIDELQTSILQVKLNLSREYERRRLEYAKSLAGQQEDLDKLKEESSEQSNQISETLAQVAQDESEWKETHLKELSTLMEKFDQATGKASDNILAQTLQEDKTLTEIAKEQKKVDWDKLISGIQGATKKPIEDVKVVSETKIVEKKIEPEKQATAPTTEPPKREEKPTVSTPSAEKPIPEKQLPEKSPQEKLPKDELSPVIPSLTKVGDDMSKVGKLKVQTPKPKTQGTKLATKQSKTGMHVCPICGQMHGSNSPHGQQPSPQQDGSGEGKLTKSGVLNTIGKISDNIQKQLDNKKFKNAFTMNYKQVQGGLQKQMKKIDKAESDISKDLKSTEKGIKTIKRKSRMKSMLGFMFGGISNILFTIIGGLILITLARMALRKWKNTYMPKTDGSTMSIFGIPIPGWDEMKAIGLGIWNFITVGIPNQFDKLSHFFGNVKQQLFGKKGIFKNAIQTRNTLRKIIGALVIANTKKVGGWIIKIIGFALSFIPGVGPFAKFLIDFAPAVYTFITTQLVLLWSNKKASAEQQAKNMAANQMASGKSQVAHFRGMLLNNAKGVKPFKGQMNVIQGLQTSKRGEKGQLPTKGAIMRSLPVHHNKNFDTASDMQEESMEKQEDAIEENVDKRLKEKKQGDLLVSIHNISEKYNKAVNDAMGQFGYDQKTNKEVAERLKKQKL